MTMVLSVLFAVTIFAQDVPPPAPVPVADPPLPEEFTRAVFFGKKFFDLGEFASAYEQYAKADSIVADHPAVLYNMALVLAKAGRYAEAQTRVDRYMQLHPAGEERALVTKLQLELAFVRELQKKRQAEQNYLELFNRGRFQYGKGDFDAALKSFEEAEAQRPTDPAAVYNQAMIHEKRGDLAKAAQRLRRYTELESDNDAKAHANQELLTLEAELEDMRTKIVCPFCGHKLPAGATWCHRCWHGPYSTSALWSSRPCADGASATRATYYSDGRFAKNDSLPCLYPSTMLESLRYSPTRQRAIHDARRGEGWTYANGLLESHKDGVRFVQGPDYLEKVIATGSGDILNYVAHAAGNGAWLLDREDVIIDGQKYTSRYTFDASNRIAQQQVEYQNGAACGHLIDMTADYTYANDALTGVKVRGGYDGFTVEGLPRVDWVADIALAYDANGRVAKEDLAITSFAKTYAQKPVGSMRDQVGKLFAGGVRAKKPLENVARVGDLCATSGSLLLGNAIDLRPFYAMSPNLAMQLPFGVSKATVTFTYPESYRVR